MDRSLHKKVNSDRRASAITQSKERMPTQNENSFYLNENLNLTIKTKNRNYVQKSFHLEKNNNVLRSHSPNYSINYINTSLSRSHSRILSPNPLKNLNEDRMNTTTISNDQEKPTSFASVLAELTRKKSKYSISQDKNINVKKISLTNDNAMLKKGSNSHTNSTPTNTSSSFVKKPSRKRTSTRAKRVNHKNRKRFRINEILLKGRIKQERHFIKKKNNIENEIVDLEDENAIISDSLNNNMQTLKNLKKDSYLIATLLEITKIASFKINCDPTVLNKYPKILIKKSDFQIFNNQMLSKDRFFEVYKGEKSSTEVMIKILNVHANNLIRFLDEISNLIGLKNEFILENYGICCESNGDVFTLYILQEFLETDLKKTIASDQKNLQKKDKLKIFKTILEVLFMLYSQNMNFCDLKPENVYISKDNMAKIDIGLIRMFKRIENKNMLQNENLLYDDLQKDLKYLGIIFYELMQGKSLDEDKKESLLKTYSKSAKLAEKDNLDIENLILRFCLSSERVDLAKTKEMIELTAKWIE